MAPRKPLRTALFIENNDSQRISSCYPGESFARVYNGIKLRLENGQIVKVQGDFYCGSMYGGAEDARCTGFYRLENVGKSPNPDFNQIHADLVKIKKSELKEGTRYLFLPEDAEKIREETFTSKNYPSR